MCENDINIEDYLGSSYHSSCESHCSSENHFCFKIDDTLNENYSNLSKELACQLTGISKELDTLKLLIILIIIYIASNRVNC